MVAWNELAQMVKIDWATPPTTQERRVTDIIEMIETATGHEIDGAVLVTFRADGNAIVDVDATGRQTLEALGLILKSLDKQGIALASNYTQKEDA